MGRGLSTHDAGRLFVCFWRNLPIPLDQWREYPGFCSNALLRIDRAWPFLRHPIALSLRHTVTSELREKSGVPVRALALLSTRVGTVQCPNRARAT